MKEKCRGFRVSYMKDLYKNKNKNLRFGIFPLYFCDGLTGKWAWKSIQIMSFAEIVKHQ